MIVDFMAFNVARVKLVDFRFDSFDLDGFEWTEVGWIRFRHFDHDLVVLRPAYYINWDTFGGLMRPFILPVGHLNRF